MINEIYQLGLEKCAGDEEAAKEFTKGFLKEALDWVSLGGKAAEGAALAVGTAGAGLAAGLAIHGLTSSMRGVADMNLRTRYEEALHKAIMSNQILQHAKAENPERLKSFGETIFRAAPHVAGDPNLLANVLTNVIHGESIDLTTVRMLSDLEKGYLDNRKNALFTPKLYR